MGVKVNQSISNSKKYLYRPIVIIRHEVKNMIDSNLYNWNFLKKIDFGVLGVDALKSAKSLGSKSMKCNCIRS